MKSDITLSTGAKVGSDCDLTFKARQETSIDPVKVLI
jgi:hypothetical protein